MTAVRFAVERQDEVVQVVVLCAACAQALANDIDPAVRRWVRPMSGVASCQSCPDKRRRRLRGRSG